MDIRKLLPLAVLFSALALAAAPACGSDAEDGGGNDRCDPDGDDPNDPSDDENCGGGGSGGGAGGSGGSGGSEEISCEFIPEMCPSALRFASVDCANACAKCEAAGACPASCEQDCRYETCNNYTNVAMGCWDEQTNRYRAQGCQQDRCAGRAYCQPDPTDTCAAGIAYPDLDCDTSCRNLQQNGQMPVLESCLSQCENAGRCTPGYNVYFGCYELSADAATAGACICNHCTPGECA